jgi:phosphoglycerate dehydrogenase-like enzyme
VAGLALALANLKNRYSGAHRSVFSQAEDCLCAAAASCVVACGRADRDHGRLSHIPEVRVTRLLLHEKSYERLRASIDAIGGIEPVLVTGEGAFTAGGRGLEADAVDPEVAWANGDVFFSPAAGREFMIAALKAPSLKWVQSGAAGFDHPIFGQLVGKGVRLTTSHGQAVGMAEYVLAGVLDHFQKGPERRAAQARGAWDRFGFRELMGSQWLIIGFGAIGQGVAERARAFGAKIAGVRRHPSPHPLADEIAGQDALPQLLPRADVVVLCAPLTAATRHLVDADFLAAMKPRSVLVNVGRGALVDEGALLAALDAGKPEHAVLDVFETEPLPSESAFWKHPRVSLTAHASGITEGQSHRNDDLFLENLRLYRAGAPLLNEAAPRDVLGE